MSIKEVLRASVWLWLAIACCAFLAFYAPHQIGILVWTLSKISIGAFVGYWIDRNLFKNQRPGDFYADPIAQRHSSYRRAIVICAVILAVAISV